MPFRRYLSRAFVEALQTTSFWNHVCSDQQLQPEIWNATTGTNGD